MKKLGILTLLILRLITMNAQVVVHPNEELALDPLIKTGTLPNGLTYYIRKNLKPQERVALRLVVKTGSTMEDEDQQGLAHLIEHMAFNGTEHFDKQELVNYLEKTGTKFGPHLNAYTSFDETVYMLQIPSRDSSILANGLLILEDWAGGLKFEKEEIDAERGVVIEEWRTRLGASERMRNIYWPVLFKNSRYENRLPIGKPEIIKNAPYDRLTAFYKEFYRPNNMAIIVVGDIDPIKIEQEIVQRFSDLQNPSSYRNNTYFEVPDHDDLRIASAIDKEASMNSVQLIKKLPKTVITTRDDFRSYLKIQLFNNMLNSRLEELSHQESPPFSMAYSGYGNLVNSKNSFSSVAYVTDEGVISGLQSLIRENNRVRLHGFVQTELSRQKKEILAWFEKAHQERDKTESSQFAYELVDHFLRGNVSPGPSAEYGLCQEFLDGITLAEINDLAKNWINEDGKNCTVIIQAADKLSVKIPTDMEIEECFRNSELIRPAAYVDKVNNKPFFDKTLVNGQITSHSIDNEFGFTHWILSNGIKVYWKKTDFKADLILFRAISKGGSNFAEESEFDNLNAASSIVRQSGLGQYSYLELEKFSKGQIANFSPFVYESTEGISGSSSKRDLEFLMQMVHHFMTEIPLEAEAMSSYRNMTRTFIENRSLDPYNTFRDTITASLYGHSIRKMPLDMKRLDEIDQIKAINLIRQRFSNPSDFSFIFVGNIEEDELRSLCVKYIASLKTSSLKEDFKKIEFNAQKPPYSKTVYAGSEDKASVQFVFSGEAIFSVEQSIMLDALQKIAQIKLRESLREKNSGTYGVGCYGSIKRNPFSSYETTISWQCSPANTQMLIGEALDVIRNLQALGCSEDDLIKIRETLRREMEINQKENYYWINNYANHLLYDEKFLNESEFISILNSINSETIKNMAKKYFSEDKLATFIQMPVTTNKK